MGNRPEIKPGDWLRVEGKDCVVSDPGDESSDNGLCQVLVDPDSTGNRAVIWAGNEWKFVAEGEYGGYAEKNPSSAKYVDQDKKDD